MIRTLALMGLFLFSMTLPYVVNNLTWKQIDQALPIMGIIEKVNLINQFGTTFNEKNFDNKLHVINFIFTNCRAACPLIIAQTQNLQKQFKALHPELPLEFVSITIDPENDSSQVLLDFAHKKNLNLDNWHLLTGNPREIENFLTQTLRTPIKEPPSSQVLPNFIELSHSSQFVLVDQKRQIRAYHSLKSSQEKALFIDKIKRLAGSTTSNL